MFDPGDILSVTLNENGSVTVYHNMHVLEEDDGLLKVQQSEQTTVINMRSLSFVKAVLQK